MQNGVRRPGIHDLIGAILLELLDDRVGNQPLHPRDERIVAKSRDCQGVDILEKGWLGRSEMVARAAG